MGWGHLISTKYVYIAELVQLPVLTTHYGDSPYKTCLYGDFLNLYCGGQKNNICTTGINVPHGHSGLILILTCQSDF
jgi:hypothetical protein